MAKMTVDELKAALKSDAGFTDEQLTGLLKPQLEALANGYMRQSDYDRAMNEGKAELAKSQADLAAANERLNTEIAEWGRVQREGGEATAAMRKDLEKAQQDVLRYQQLVTR